MSSRSPTNNLLLNSLSSSSRTQILAQADEMSLPVRTSLHAQGEVPRFAYFITSGLASVVVCSEEGGSAETSLIGSEGVTGAFSLLGPFDPTTDCFMQIAGSGYRISFRKLRQLFGDSDEIRSRILECVQLQGMTTSQIAACNKLHDTEERLARWLLMVQDRTGEASFQLTQEFLAMMLGTRRTTVALVAGSLQRAGFLEYARGKVTILSREKLEGAACDCYEVTHVMLAKLYQGSLVDAAADDNSLSMA